jgi:hypothetical protein
VLPARVHSHLPTITARLPAIATHQKRWLVTVGLVTGGLVTVFRLVTGGLVTVFRLVTVFL